MRIEPDDLLYKALLDRLDAIDKVVNSLQGMIEVLTNRLDAIDVIVSRR